MNTNNIAKSSIHYQKGERHSFFHNDRSHATINSIFDQSKNYYSRTGKEAVQLFDKLVKERKEIYEKRMKRKLDKRVVKHLSFITNIKPDTTKEEIEKLIKYIEEELDTKVVQYAFHRDEGRKDENGNEIINQHCHVEAIGLDSNGNSIVRKINKPFLYKLQDKTAEILKMERGKTTRITEQDRINAKKIATERSSSSNTTFDLEYEKIMKSIKRNKKTHQSQRIDHHTYKKTQQKIKLIKEISKNEMIDLKSEINNLKKEVVQVSNKKATKMFVKNFGKKVREIYKSNNMERSDYAVLEAKLKELTNKNKELTQEDVFMSILELSISKKQIEIDKKEVTKIIKQNTRDIIDSVTNTFGMVNKEKLETKINSLQTKATNYTVISREAKKLKAENENLELEKNNLESKIKKLENVENEILKIKTENNKIKTENRKLEDKNKILEIENEELENKFEKSKIEFENKFKNFEIINERLKAKIKKLMPKKSHSYDMDFS